MNIILTGSTSGIGWETLKGLYPDATNFILPVRNLQKAHTLFSKLPSTDKIDLIEMDLSILESVKKGADQIAKKYDKIDLMINNAGGMFPAGKRTQDALDQTFMVNHLAHFLLMKSLLPNLLKAKGKVIAISSEAHRVASVNEKDFGLLRTSNTLHAYGNAKLYNILTTKYLAKTYGDAGLTAYALHPGAVRTAFGGDSGTIAKALIRVTQLFFISPKQGAETTLYLSRAEDKNLTNGGYYDKKKLKTPTSKARDQKQAEKLWGFSEELLSSKGY